MFIRRDFLIGGAAALFFPTAAGRANIQQQTSFVEFNAPRRQYGFVARLYVHSAHQSISWRETAGMSLQEIAADLNAHGFKAANGETWTAASVAEIIKLEQEIYGSDLRPCL